MEGIIAHFRGSMSKKRGNHLIVVVPGIDNREKAEALIGKSAVWTAPGAQKKQIKGQIAAPHGNKGAVRVLFETGMPGQSLGQEVKIH